MADSTSTALRKEAHHALSQTPPTSGRWSGMPVGRNHGQGVYHEIEHYPLAKATGVDDILRHPWPTTDHYDYTVLPDRIRAIQADGERCILVANGNVFESSWYMRGMEQMFIDMGIDVLQALQFDAAGMDAVEMKRLHGTTLCFEGGVSVQKTLPFGTPGQVADEVRHLISTLGKKGGYILGPSHAIQAGTPPENIHALFETARCFYPHG